ncbi:mitochondrial 37S ribosomal protein uS15m [Aspergillus mulundensis]|uniref:Ribosomal protein S15 n=1 Tax=Aspergillus mulundensis TaxID=1810919 RepID=A0A3D8SL05_9EURO|nr:hypothetical protein DSM5745_03526 [Aspergillus mulundensis]RDW86884.1 hypothetical protein DSM5745_03526 [Aspergillus mulundensis]
MPPRLPFQPSLKAFTGSSHVQSPLARLSLNPSKTSVRAGSAESRERRRHDPFLMAQSRQRKAANLSRQQALAAERDGSVGDPVHGDSTPFIEELKIQQAGTQEFHPNHFITSEELLGALEYSENLTSPIEEPNRAAADPQLEKENQERHVKKHYNATEAIRRIVDIRNGNTGDQMRLRIQKCIETFGRHRTDQTLPPKPAAVPPEGATRHLERARRVGPDTGSSEVQVAILTAKILNLSRHLETTNKDKHNKRNLRLLVHKRQKLLQYLRRKERGGPRWQNLIDTLGLSEASWKGEISM